MDSTQNPETIEIPVAPHIQEGLTNDNSIVLEHIKTNPQQ